MDLFLENKVIIVTGGGRGIGQSICCALSEERAVPVFVEKDYEAGQLLESNFKNKGADCLFIHRDLSQPDACKAIVELTLEKYGSIDGIVNNAGVNDGVGLENGCPSDFEKSLSTNLLHYYNLVHYALPALKKSEASIVNISSKTALTGQGNTSGYAGSKGAQLALTREWAVELAKYNIRVNAIVPAEVMTPQYEKWINLSRNKDRVLEEITQRIPLGKRMTQAKEIASTAIFLLSKQSSHTTGQWFFVDGGYVHLDRAIN
ncbi:MAG: SDR family oxidoreductase [Cyclobacteriaceae bacterium]